MEHIRGKRVRLTVRNGSVYGRVVDDSDRAAMVRAGTIANPHVNLLDPGSLVAFIAVDAEGTASSQHSRPSSSGSSDREVLVRLRRDRSGTFKVIRTGAAVRGEKRPNRRCRDHEGPSRWSPLSPEREHDTPPTPNLATRKRRRSGMEGSDTEETGQVDGARDKESDLGQRIQPTGPTNESTPPPSGGEGLDHEAGSRKGGRVPRRRDGGDVEVDATQSRNAAQPTLIAIVAERFPNANPKVHRLILQATCLFANDEVARRWKELLILWRSEGTLLKLRPVRQGVTQEEERASIRQRVWLQNVDNWDREFVVLYDRTKRSQAMNTLDDLRIRLQMADLGSRYHALQAGVSSDSTRPRREVAKEEMFAWLTGSEDKKSAKWREFERDIKYWKRWLSVVSRLGRGSVALFPDVVKKSFVEQTLKVDELTTWLVMVQDVRPEIITLGERLLPYLDAALAGLSAPTERTLLEGWDETVEGLRLLGPAWFEPDTSIPLTPPDGFGANMVERQDWSTDDFLDLEGAFGSDIQI